MIYMPPGVPHSFTSSSTAQGERLIFILGARAWKAHGGGKHQPSSIAASQLCKELLFHLLLHPKTKAASSLLATLVQTVSEMLEESGPGNSGELAHLAGKTSDARVQKALTLIEARFAESLPMDALAKTAGLSVRNLNRLFLEELGLTPKQVVTLHRIEAAKRALQQRKSVTDVALDVGYSSVSQFITTFRRVTGQLPSEFR
jgi:AraC-like DNA-binding protein